MAVRSNRFCVGSENSAPQGHITKETPEDVMPRLGFITGDIRCSSGMNPVGLTSLLGGLRQAWRDIRVHLRGGFAHSAELALFSGDSFQGTCSQKDSPLIWVLLKTWIKGAKYLCSGMGISDLISPDARILVGMSQDGISHLDFDNPNLSRGVYLGKLSKILRAGVEGIELSAMVGTVSENLLAITQHRAERMITLVNSLMRAEAATVYKSLHSSEEYIDAQRFRTYNFIEGIPLEVYESAREARNQIVEDAYKLSETIELWARKRPKGA